jgi:hypothetical membrane protein
MKPSAMIQTFTDRYPFVGPALWISSIQYYVVQVIVARAWTIVPYSWRGNTISDLGNTVCGQYGERYVCSPRHALMNLSFMILGITMFLGAVLLYREFKRTNGSFLGFSFMAYAGVGTILVGFFPENTSSILHFLGAGLPFLLGNIGLLILGYSLDIPTYLRRFTILSGVVSLIALAFFVSHHYLIFEIGGMERLAIYPQTVWLIVFGVYISKNRMRELV